MKNIVVMYTVSVVVHVDAELDEWPDDIPQTEGVIVYDLVGWVIET